MVRWPITLLLLLSLSQAAPAMPPGDAGAGLYARGCALLEQAEFAGALDALAAAARAAPDNETYRQEHAMLRQVLQLRDALDRIEEAEQWNRTALALRTYYVDHRVYDQALDVDRARHERVDSVESAAMLAETMLLLDMNHEAVRLLEGLGERQSLRTIAQHGLAHARLGEMAPTRRLLGQLDGLERNDEADSAVWLDVACLRARLDDAKGAATALEHSFRRTPPSRLDAAKSFARGLPDLTGLVAEDAFAEVWRTASEVAESNCSLGSSCAACPSRAACEGG
jgi:tetratricopeptide (TPR) repeat protein